MINRIYKIIGSGILTGYIPFAPGTFGSLLAVFLWFFVHEEPLLIKSIILIVSFFIGVFLGNKFEIEYGKDPKQFTWDEFVGTWLTFLISPQNIIMWISGFIIWRILDIVKPFPANRAESIKGGMGIMLDDIISGMYSLIIIYIFSSLLN